MGQASPKAWAQTPALGATGTITGSVATPLAGGSEIQVNWQRALSTLNTASQLNFAFYGDAFLKTGAEHKIPLFKWHV